LSRWRRFTQELYHWWNSPSLWGVHLISYANIKARTSGSENTTFKKKSLLAELVEAHWLRLLLFLLKRILLIRKKGKPARLATGGGPTFPSPGQYVPVGIRLSLINYLLVPGVTRAQPLEKDSRRPSSVLSPGTFPPLGWQGTHVMWATWGLIFYKVNNTGNLTSCFETETFHVLASCFSLLETRTSCSHGKGEGEAAIVSCAPTHMYHRKRHCWNLRTWPESNLRSLRAQRSTAQPVDPNPIFFHLKAHCDLEGDWHMTSSWCPYSDHSKHFLGHVQWLQVRLESLHLAVSFLKEHGLISSFLYYGLL
jgi:hypothetical protein